MVTSSTDEAKTAPTATTDPTPETQTQDEGLHVIIIGAGLAGLAAALSTKLANPNHQVTILEAVKELQEVGAGLQITPNGTRLLSHWGLSSILAPFASVPTSLSVHRYDGTKLLAYEPNLQSRMFSRYGHPLWDLHRVDLQRELVKKCLSLNITIRLNSRVTGVDFSTNTIHLGLIPNPLKNTLSADVILLTDGLWSTIRPQFLSTPSPPTTPTPTGDLAYRLTIPTTSLTGPDLPLLHQFITSPTINLWLGPHSHCIGYTISSSNSSQTYNLIFLTPDSPLPSTPTSPPSLLSKFSNWDPLLQKLISHATSISKWKLMWLPPLPRWTNPSGTFFLAGDCCHPMLPYLAQGANSSLEDGAVFGHLLSKVKKSTSGQQLPKMAAMYEQLRMERSKRVQLETFKQRDDSHLPDGPAQQARDELMTSQLQNDDVRPGFPSRWTDPEVQAFLYGYDAYGEAERAYQEDPY
ncbi:putative salicylate hydroxylase [Triangularia verruculosa]|uniref:Salicylate hydroxylase n=1 Tax=Triangularia verruculosa TaxID=2587418 RepID=A0AAN6XMD7_9PEZI|nr:putative salicylate hydroxylase [Triangularia verruculosa]